MLPFICGPILIVDLPSRTFGSSFSTVDQMGVDVLGVDILGLGSVKLDVMLMLNSNGKKI